MPSSLRGRLTMAVGLASVLVVLSSSTVLYLLVSRQSDTALTRSMKQRIERIVALGSDGKFFPRSESYAQVIQLLPVGGRRLVVFHSVPAGEESVLTSAELGAVSASGLITAKKVETLDGATRILAQRHTIDGIESIVVVGSPLTALDLQKDRTEASLAIGGPILAGLLTLGGWLIVGAALRPVRRMTDEAAAISSADSRRRLPLPKRRDEISHLGQTLNAMLDRIETSFERERRFVDDASHELRTPLGIMRAEVELALMELDRPSARDVSGTNAGTTATGTTATGTTATGTTATGTTATGTTAAASRATLQSLLDEIDRLGSLAEDLLALSTSRREGSTERETISTEVLAITNRTVDRLKPALPRLTGSSPRIEVRGGETHAAVRPEDWERIVTNLVANATRFAKEHVLVEVSSHDGMVRLLVADDGPGFPAELLPHAFERFRVANPARTRSLPLKRAKSGTGLGLAIVKAVAESAEGSAHAENGPPYGGARVIIDIPVAGPGVVPKDPAAPASDRARPGPPL